MQRQLQLRAAEQRAKPVRAPTKTVGDGILGCADGPFNCYFTIWNLSVDRNAVTKRTAIRLNGQVNEERQ